MFYVYLCSLSIFYPLAQSPNHNYVVLFFFFFFFFSSYCFTQDLICRKTIGVGQVLDGLYLLRCSSLSQDSPSLDDFLSTYQLGHFSAFSSTFSIQNSLSTPWHSKLGHPSDSRLHSLSHLLTPLQNSCNKDCIVCPLAKQKWLPFPSNNMSSCSFDLVRMMYGGPILFLLWKVLNTFSLLLMMPLELLGFSLWYPSLKLNL